TSQLMGQPLDEKLMAIAQEKLDKLNETPEALEYFQAEMDLNKIFKEVSQIIGEAMTLLS
ncbi:MAG: YlbF family regulator, partial [Acidaminobacteraceae bacterium]